jgi:RNA polymerase sigma factor (sigma-70 family)
VDKVHTHDSSLRAYLRVSFPNVRDVEDVVQESYLRIWKAHTRHQIATARAFLFKVARNVALDWQRKERRSPTDLRGDLSDVHVVADTNTAADNVSVAEKTQLLAKAIARLPERRRHILILCKFEGLRRRDVATRLGITERTVDEQLARSIRYLESYMREHGVDGLFGL